ncbi:hypothetical protein IBX84_05700 [Neisseria gonorrhoeae]|nr:hypothetical protein IBX84_05700 [Neisseria gonorrhoeae]
MFETSQVTTYTATLLGAKKFKGEIDGNKIDSCTVLVASPMPSNGNAVGSVAMESTGKGLVQKLLDFQVKGAAPKA